MDPELQKKLDGLSPEQVEMFTRALELAVRKKRVRLIGYALTAVSLLLGTLWALYIYGKTLGSGESMLWVFFVPLALAAIILMTFGRISNNIK